MDRGKIDSDLVDSNSHPSLSCRKDSFSAITQHTEGIELQPASHKPEDFDQSSTDPFTRSTVLNSGIEFMPSLGRSSKQAAMLSVTLSRPGSTYTTIRYHDIITESETSMASGTDVDVRPTALQMASFDHGKGFKPTFHQ